MSTNSDFDRQGFAVYRDVISAQTRSLIGEEYRILLANDRLRHGDPQVKDGYAAYGLTVTEALMEHLLPFMERETGHALYPTYSYGRVYLKGAELSRHVDRPACEISLSLMVEQRGSGPWPLYCQSLTGEVVAVELSPGDLMIYKGVEVPHWREPFDGESQLQIFLHYVRQDGPYADERYDRRPRLGAPPVTAPPKPPLPLSIFRDGRRP
jgi:hypothetical protein